MIKLYTLVMVASVATLLVACNDRIDRAEPPIAPVVEPPPAVFPVTPGPVVGLPIRPPEGFFVGTVSGLASSPVVAVTPDNQLHYAYVDGETSWPVVSRAEGTPAALPGEGGATLAVAMAASADGTLHFVWDPEGEIHYVRRHPDGRFEAPVVLDTTASRDPNLAITPAGDVVVAWTHDFFVADGERGIPSEIRVARGSSASGAVAFDAVRAANAGCCFNEFEEPAERVSGPSLAIGHDDSIHVVYEWSTFTNTTIEYVNDRDGDFGAAVQISNAAYVPCPSVNVDADGVAHITFLREIESYVLYVTVRDGVASEEVRLHTPEEGRATMALSHLAEDGTLHLGVTEQYGSSYRLVYSRSGEVPMVTQVMSMEDSLIELTPRAGGMLVAPDGKLVFSFSTGPRNEPRPAHFAVGDPSFPEGS